MMCEEVEIMGTNPNPAVASARTYTPFSGQPDADVVAWFRAKYPKGLTPMSARAYSAALYNNDKPPSQDDDLAGYNAWYDRLTSYQRKVLEIAKRQKSVDPAVIAKRKARRNADPYYQAQLETQRAQYAAMVEAGNDRPVRSYRRGAKLTDDEKKVERRERNENLRARIRSALAVGRNPFEFEFDTVETTKDKRRLTNYEVCARLLEVGEFDPADNAQIVALSDSVDVPHDEARKMIAGAVEMLRTAKAISKSGGKIRLRDDLKNQAEVEQSALESLPNFGAF